MPTVGRFSIHDGKNWVALIVFLVAAAIAITRAQAARSRATETEHRCGEGNPSAVRGDCAPVPARVVSGALSGQWSS